MDDWDLPAEPERITLEDGTQLDARQSQAVTLYTETDATIEQIASQTGYADRSVASRFLNSDLGKAGVQAALTQRLSRAGIIGLTTLMDLAAGSKSDLVRRQAAADLVDMAGMKAKPNGSGTPNGSSRPEGKVLIQINTGSGDTAEAKVIPADFQPDNTSQGGPGEK